MSLAANALIAARRALLAVISLKFPVLFMLRAAPNPCMLRETRWGPR